MKKIFMLMALAAVLPLSAKVTLPSVLDSDMVLQQQSKVKLWGKADPGKKIAITPSWGDGKTTTVKADKDGKWLAEVETIEAGGPYTLTFDDGDKVVLDNILLGEVWFCSGQSNMEMPVRGFDRQPVTGSNDVIARAKESTPIRMFVSDTKDGHYVRQWATTPQEDMYGKWLTNTPENVAITSAAAYHFAKYLNDVLEVPVGLVISTLGGSKVECWMSREALEQFPSIDLSHLDNGVEPKNLHSDPGYLYNAKVAPLTNFTVKGMLWYQGESNCGNYKEYRELVPAFVKDLREKWGNDEMPFYYVEIAPFNYEGPKGISAARLREVQAEHMKLIPHSGMVTTIDIGNDYTIHPLNKETVGQRLAWWALGDTYGLKAIGYAPPTYRSMEIKDGKIYINVDNGGNGLCPMWTSLKGFEIAGEDKVFHPAFAEVETSTCRLAVSSKDVPNPVAVRYGYCNVPDAYVFNIQGLPLVPFRTDDWD